MKKIKYLAGILFLMSNNANLNAMEEQVVTAEQVAMEQQTESSYTFPEIRINQGDECVYSSKKEDWTADLSKCKGCERQYTCSTSKSFTYYDQSLSKDAFVQLLIYFISNSRAFRTRLDVLCAVLKSEKDESLCIGADEVHPGEKLAFSIDFDQAGNFSSCHSSLGENKINKKFPGLRIVQ